MEITIRKPNLEPLVDGVPKDFAEVRDYFNRALTEGTLPWIPRKTPITDKEITELWMPSLKTNICLVAELNGKIVGSAVVLYDPKSNEYEHKEKRVPGNIGSTAKPKVYKQVIGRLLPEIIGELKKQDKTAIWNLAEESPANGIMSGLGYLPKILENVTRYKQTGLSGKVFEYQLP